MQSKIVLEKEFLLPKNVYYLQYFPIYCIIVEFFLTYMITYIYLSIYLPVYLCTFFANVLRGNWIISTEMNCNETRQNETATALHRYLNRNPVITWLKCTFNTQFKSFAHWIVQMHLYVYRTHSYITLY